MNYISIPKEIKINELINNNFSFSPSTYKKVEIKNNNVQLLSELLYDKLSIAYKGHEIGSSCYIFNSSHFFIRTKALQPNTFLPNFEKESVVPILPKKFKNCFLSKDDILISKDSNIGEIIILDKDYPNYMISGGIYKLPIKNFKYYILALIKSDFFKTQLDFIVSKGVTIRHAKTLFLDCKIPFPKDKKVINYVEKLTIAIINKEKEIRNRYNQIIELIDTELNKNQKNNSFKYNYPTFDDIIKYNRLNAGFYSEKIKKIVFIIQNYLNGYSNLTNLGFEMCRGQNLQISCIGKSIYSNKYKNGFYHLILPKTLSIYGTVKENIYLGNPKKLKTLKKGDIIFGAEGFEKGRSIVVFDDDDKALTNIHGITINHKNKNMILSTFVKCFLDYLRKKGILDLFAVGGNGGSLAQKYWVMIPFPNFAEDKQIEIYKKYYNNYDKNELNNSNLENFLDNDEIFNNNSGIIQLDETIKIIKNHIDKIINKIINDEDVIIKFNIFE